MTEREALKLALEALEKSMYPQQTQLKAIAAIKEALAQTEQEPVAYRSRMRNRDGQVITGWVVHLETTENPDPRVEIEPLYTTPPQRTWVGLTHSDIDQGLLRSDYAFKTAEAWRAGVVFAMTKLKQKNGYDS